MSRIGLKPIEIPAGVDVKVDGTTVTVKGPKGELTRNVHPNMAVAVEGNEVIVKRPNDEKENKSLHGLTRTLIHNMMQTEGNMKSYVGKIRKDLELALAAIDELDRMKAPLGDGAAQESFAEAETEAAEDEEK